MSKKIIALALVLVTIATVFTACQKKLDIYKVAGKDVAVLTNEDGKVVIDDKNRLCALVTDEDGEIITYENKEPQTRWITLKNAFIADNTVYTHAFVMEGIDGWEFNPLGALEKEKTDGKCKISCSFVAEKEYLETPLDEYIDIYDQRNAAALALFEKEGYKVTVEKKLVEATAKKTPMVYYKQVIYNSDGSIVNYGESLYFSAGGTDKYIIQYSSSEGVGLDDSFNLMDFVNSNFQVREIKEEESTQVPETSTEAQ